MPDSPIAAQWRTRANALIAESDRTHQALVAGLPQFRSIVNTYLHALSTYRQTSAQSDERDALEALARRAGQRALLFARRNEVTGAQVAVEGDLRLINERIYWVQVTIAAGKMAEVGISMATWIKSVKTNVDRAKNILDTAKTAQPFVQAAVGAAGHGGSSTPAPAEQAAAIAQILVYFSRFSEGFEAAKKVFWDGIGTFRRARTMNDRWTGLATAAQALKVVVELLKVWVEHTFRTIEVTSSAAGTPARGVVPGNAAWLSHLGNCLTILRDLIDAYRALEAAYKASEEIKSGIEQIERQITLGNRFMGNEADALASLPSLKGLEEEDVEMLATAANDFNAARVLGNEARQRATQLASDIAAAQTLLREASLRLQPALQAIRPHIEAMQEQMDSHKRQIVNMQWVPANGPDGAAAKAVMDDLSKHRDLLQPVFNEARALAASIG
ncbi:hypothetical protein WJU23_15695 [Prosthecobacter sp. SYSU 5D2]|uniref:hypothetical protein n=1 Tax=Prosthecobacter sp. SYSU 5D2 TaxID=3134134 RepID=UPI0031FEA102